MASGARLQRAPDPTQRAGKTQECLAQTDEILPGIGVVGAIGREETLIEVLGSEYDPLKKQILASPEARKFVCEAGVPAVLAIWDTRTATLALDVTAAQLALKADSAKIYSQNLDTAWMRHRRIARVENQLLDVGNSVHTEVKETHVPAVLVRPLAVPQRDNLQGAALELEALAPVFEKATTEFSASVSTAFRLREKSDEARVEAEKMRNPDYAGSPRESLQKSLDLATTLQQQLEIVHAGMNVGDLKQVSSHVFEQVRKPNDSPLTTPSDTIRTVRDNAASLRKNIADGSSDVLGFAGAPRRVAFALRYLAALNTPNFAGALIKT